MGRSSYLNITVIVLGGPNEAALAFDDLRYHVINEPMLIPQPVLLKVGFICALIDILEDIFKPPIVPNRKYSSVL